MEKKHDKGAAMLSIYAGANGAESQDWAEILMRMYLRWAQNNGYKATLVNQTLQVEGEYAYGCLKAEQGTHRLVRISPFDPDSRRHTSFALVKVVPGTEEDVEETDWSTLIRSYCLDPYQIVRDHRTGYETVDVEAVLEGRLDGFIGAYPHTSGE
jgi:protein subunit release factor B